MTILRKEPQPGTPIALPPQRPYRTAGTMANGWTDQYGAMHVAAAYAGLGLTPGYAVNGVWHHGCKGPWLDFSADVLANNTPNARALPVFTVRRDQADLMQQHGYTRARAIGAPILYAQPSGATRQRGSLLVMPTHTLAGDSFPDRTPFERYAEEVAAVADDFARVVVCIHPSCRKNGLWIGEFSALGFELVDGAMPNDLNALGRMRALFEQFETVTTNGWGSHVAYALAFGARVAIHGSRPEKTEADYLRDASWAANPAGLKQWLSDTTKQREREFLARFHVEPTAAVADVAFGESLLGQDARVSPEAMAAVLAELVTPTPRPAAEIDQIVRAQREKLERARSARGRVLKQVTALEQAGRRGEAAQALMAAMKADASTNDVAVILEGLLAIGDRLVVLDPPRGSVLLGQAEKLARAQGTSLARLRIRAMAA